MSEFFKDYVESTKKVKTPGRIKMNRPLVPSNGLKSLGIELEIEGNRLPNEGHLDGIRSPSGSSWITHEDGSLRGESREYVLSQPVEIEEIDHLLSSLWNTFRVLDTRFRLSNRCSTHVHYNVSGLKLNEVTSVIALWTTVEEIMINWCGEERINNHFCLSTKECDYSLYLWNLYLRNGASNFSDGLKYTAMNLRSIWNIGSIEFRCMRASEDYDVILEWIKFVNGICKYAVKNYKNPATIANEVSERGGIAMFEDICRFAGNSEDFVRSVYESPDNVRSVPDKIMEGFRRCQALCLEHPWYDWIPLIEEEYVPEPFGKKTRKTEEEVAIDGLNWDELDIQMPEGGRLAPAPGRARAFQELDNALNNPRMPRFVEFTENTGNARVVIR